MICRVYPREDAYEGPHIADGPDLVIGYASGYRASWQTALGQIPAELEDAARVDGFSRLKTLTHIILPISAPALASTALLVFIFSWNEYVIALTLNVQTLPVGVSMLSGLTEYEIPRGQISAAIVMTTLPIVAAVLAFQRWIIGGLTAGKAERDKRILNRGRHFNELILGSIDLVAEFVEHLRRLIKVLTKNDRRFCHTLVDVARRLDRADGKVPHQLDATRHDAKRDQLFKRTDHARLYAAAEIVACFLGLFRPFLKFLEITSRVFCARSPPQKL